MLPLAYHAEDEIARVVAISELVLAILLVVIGVALMRRMAGAPSGRNRLARIAAVVVAIGILAYVLHGAIPYGDDPSNALIGVGFFLLLTMLAVGVVGPVLAIFALEQVRYTGQRRLAVLAFVASLVLPGIFVANFVACLTTDACFH